MPHEMSWRNVRIDQRPPEEPCPCDGATMEFLRRFPGAVWAVLGARHLSLLEACQHLGLAGDEPRLLRPYYIARKLMLGDRR